jgi:hypothetical protein
MPFTIHSVPKNSLRLSKFRASARKELFVLMKWQEPQNEIFGHDLPDHQVKIITEWIGRDRSSPRWVVQLIGMS